jgi:chemotaxis signal transduction protein
VSARDDSGAAALRRAFDEAFAAPPRAARRDDVTLLALRAGGEAVALRVLETAGFLRAPRIVPVPSRRGELLGVAGLRGAAVPVFGLARLLGRAEADEPRWIVLCEAGGERVALAFATFERHLVVPASSLHPAPGGAAGPHVAEILEHDGASRPILGVASLARAITGG